MTSGRREVLKNIGKIRFEPSSSGVRVEHSTTLSQKSVFTLVHSKLKVESTVCTDLRVGPDRGRVGARPPLPTRAGATGSNEVNPDQS